MAARSILDLAKERNTRRNSLTHGAAKGGTSSKPPTPHHHHRQLLSSSVSFSQIPQFAEDDEAEEEEGIMIEGEQQHQHADGWQIVSTASGGGGSSQTQQSEPLSSSSPPPPLSVGALRSVPDSSSVSPQQQQPVIRRFGSSPKLSSSTNDAAHLKRGAMSFSANAASSKRRQSQSVLLTSSGVGRNGGGGESPLARSRRSNLSQNFAEASSNQSGGNSPLSAHSSAYSLAPRHNSAAAERIRVLEAKVDLQASTIAKLEALCEQMAQDAAQAHVDKTMALTQSHVAEKRYTQQKHRIEELEKTVFDLSKLVRQYAPKPHQSEEILLSTHLPSREEIRAAAAAAVDLETKREK